MQGEIDCLYRTEFNPGVRLSSSLWLAFALLLGVSATPFLFGDASTQQQFLLGILGNVVAAFIVLPGFWLLNLIEIRGSEIRKFFGIRSNSTFFIFVGRLNDPNVSGGVADVVELNEAHELRSTLQKFVPGLGDAFFLRRLRLVDVEIEVIVADNARDYGQYRNTSFMTIGSGGSNGVSKMIEQELRVRLDFATQKIKIGNNREENSARRGLIVCKCHSSANVWFYVAGQTGPDTTTAARFLRKNWKLMSQKYQRTDFYYLLDTSQGVSGLLPSVSKTPRSR